MAEASGKSTGTAPPARETLAPIAAMVSVMGDVRKAIAPANAPAASASAPVDIAPQAAATLYAMSAITKVPSAIPMSVTSV